MGHRRAAHGEAAHREKEELQAKAAALGIPGPQLLDLYANMPHKATPPTLLVTRYYFVRFPAARA